MKPRVLVLLLSAVAACLPSCSEQQAEAQGNQQGSERMPRAAAGAVADLPLPAFQGELLDMAFESVTAMPVDPHIKDRSRAQEAVVAACLELGQPLRVLAYLERIDNWRRGSCHAEVALYCAQHGDPEGARRSVAAARRIADEVAKDPNEQEWRIDHIRVKVAKVLLLLGDDAGRFDDQLRGLDAVLASGGLDHARNALEAAREMLDRHYPDAERRSKVERTIESGSARLPLDIQIDLLLERSAIAARHQDRGRAIELAGRAGETVDKARWLPDQHVRLLARVSAARSRAGQVAEARADVDAALRLYESERDRIVNIDRAGALRAVAEAYHAAGDAAAALAIYAKAVEEGVVNPNSRPRAEDLAATCCSMALHRVEPDAALRARMTQVRQALGPPW